MLPIGVVSLFADMSYEGAGDAPGPFLGFLGASAFGAVMGIQESIMRAAVAGMIPANGRGTAYGVFSTG